MGYTKRKIPLNILLERILANCNKIDKSVNNLSVIRLSSNSLKNEGLISDIELELTYRRLSDKVVIRIEDIINRNTLL